MECKEIKPVHLKEISPEYSLEGLTLKCPYYDHLLQTANSWRKTPTLGKTERKRRGWQRMRERDSITDSKDMNLNKLWETVMDREA